MTPNITDEQIRVALRAFLLAAIGGSFEVIRGQINRVPEPLTRDYAVFWPTSRARLGTNVETWDASSPAADAYDYTAPTQVSFQVDVHGAVSADNAQTIATLWRSPYAIDAMGDGISPLYCEDPRQMPFLNAEQQAEFRWIVELQIQVSPTVSTPAQFADTLDVTTAAPVDSGALS